MKKGSIHCTMVRTQSLIDPLISFPLFHPLEHFRPFFKSFSSWKFHIFPCILPNIAAKYNPGKKKNSRQSQLFFRRLFLPFVFLITPPGSIPHGQGHGDCRNPEPGFDAVSRCRRNHRPRRTGRRRRRGRPYTRNPSPYARQQGQQPRAKFPHAPYISFSFITTSKRISQNQSKHILCALRHKKMGVFFIIPLSS